MKKILLAIPLFFSLLSNNVQAIIEKNDIEFHGFASQGFVYSPDNPYAGRESLDGSADFRELGINANLTIGEQTHIAGQVFYRDFGEVNKAETNLDFIFLDHRFIDDSDSFLGVRLGRYKNEFGLYNASRDLPMARPGLNVPESIYFEALRDSVLAIDGIALYGGSSLSYGLIEYMIHYGDRDIASELLEKYVLNSAIPGEAQPESVWGFKIDFQPNQISGLEFGFSSLFTRLILEDSLSAAETKSNFTNDLLNRGINPLDPASQPAINEYLSNNVGNYINDVDLELATYAVSLRYAFDDWAISTEVMNIYADASISVLGETRSDMMVARGAYLQAEYFPMQELELLIRVEELNLGLDLDLPNELEDRQNATGVSVGVKCHFAPNWSFGIQSSLYKGYAWAPVYEETHQDSIREYWRVHRAELSYQF